VTKKKKGNIHERSYLERHFERIIQVYKLPVPKREYVFHKFRFDYVYIGLKIAIEIDGGTFSRYGGHATGKRYQRDCIKNNLAQVEGWAVLRADREMIMDPDKSREFASAVRKTVLNRLNCKKTRKLPF